MSKTPYFTNPPLILASASPVRRSLLESTGVAFTIVHSAFDEEQVREEIAHLSVIEQAAYLASEKAAAVSREYLDYLVLGADQIGEWEGGLLFKPNTHENAFNQLKALRGKTHYQRTALSLYHQGKAIWQYTESAELAMRVLSDREIDYYLRMDQPYQCCGGYRFEGLGKHLFSEIKGSADCILGLPLLPLLNFFYNKALILNNG